MTFAIDFDGTWAEDPPLFSAIVQAMKDRGHTVVCVTRGEDKPNGEVRRVVGKQCPIVFAGEWKKSTAAQRAGYRVDVWIDDNPQYIG